MRYRWPLDGPEPPPTVTRVWIGCTIHGWRGVWRRVSCRQQCRTIIWPTGRHPGRMNRWHGGRAWRCCVGPGRGDDHYHWTNGDKSRPWVMLTNRAHRPHAVDLDATRQLHAAYRARHRKAFR